ncbi:MAG: flagellar hook-associated protein 2 [Thioalkalivibrio sp.]|nr:MAG: flagellar hook-associated protein 2 [Thioalkalivibrio sp.]
MAISSLGVGSGLDLNALVDQLVAAEREPKVQRLDRREADIQARISGFGAARGGLSGLETALDKLSKLQQVRTASSSDGNRLEVSARPGAATGSYTVEVNQLATAQSLASGRFEDAGASLGTGTLSLQVGDGEAVAIEIDEENNSLRGIREAINGANAGVQASIVNDGEGARLVLSAARTGADQTVSITVSGDEGEVGDLGRLATGNLTETVPGRNAELVLNGLPVTSPSNNLDETLEGLNLQLKGTTEPGAPITVTVGEDRAAVREALNEFVKAYNGVIDTVRDLTRFNPETQEGAAMVGDSTLRSVQGRLAQGLQTSGTDPEAAFTNLVNLGVNSDRNGRLSLDGAALDQAMDQDFRGAIGLVNEVSAGLRESVKGFTEPGGLLESRTEGLQTRMKGIGRERETLDLRIERLEARLVRQFGAMDALVGQLQSTSQFLDQQLGALNAMFDRGR